MARTPPCHSREGGNLLANFPYEIPGHVALLLSGMTDVGALAGDFHFTKKRKQIAPIANFFHFCKFY